MATLSNEELEKLEPHLEEVPLGYLETLYRQGELIQYVHFVRRGVVSIVKEIAPGLEVEICAAGWEGMAGLPIALGLEAASERAYTQIDGNAMRMEARAFRQAMADIPGLHRIVGRYAAIVLNQFVRDAACTHSHTVEQRCARWLLKVHDQIQEKTFPLTHQFLAQMVSAQRPTVSSAASSLQEAGLIHYTRGVITIANRRGLEAASCRCYADIRAEYERLLQ